MFIFHLSGGRNNTNRHKSIVTVEKLSYARFILWRWLKNNPLLIFRWPLAHFAVTFLIIGVDISIDKITMNGEQREESFLISITSNKLHIKGNAPFWKYSFSPYGKFLFFFFNFKYGAKTSEIINVYYFTRNV